MRSGLAALVTLSSCAPSESMYNDRVHNMKIDPTYLNDFTDNCIQHYHGSKERVALLSRVYGVPQQQVAKTFCKRFTAGLTSGQLTYQDVKGVYTEKTLSPKVRKILYGR